MFLNEIEMVKTYKKPKKKLSKTFDSLPAFCYTETVKRV